MAGPNPQTFWVPVAGTRWAGDWRVWGRASNLGVVLMHHVSAYTGEWWHGACDDCGWWGREYRTPDTARKWMERHAGRCKGRKAR